MHIVGTIRSVTAIAVEIIINMSCEATPVEPSVRSRAVADQIAVSLTVPESRFEFANCLGLQTV